MVELNYYLKIMEYLRSQVELMIPLDEDREIPMHIDSLELKILILHKAGFLEVLKDKLKENYFTQAAKILTTMLCKQSSSWKQIHNILIELEGDEAEVGKKTGKGPD